MPVSERFFAFVVDQLDACGPITAKRMFGGVGLYAGDRFFAILMNDTIYLKVDDTTRVSYEAAGSRPFNPFPERGGSMQYFEVPLAVIENADELARWARTSIAVAGAKPATTRARSRSRMRWLCVLVVPAVLMAVVADVSAQQEPPRSQPADGAHWGVQATVSPIAPVPGSSLGKVFNDQGSVDIRLNAFEIGLIRGRTTGGDAGVELVYRRIEDGSSLSRLLPASCTTFPGTTSLCFPETGTLDRISGASLLGVSVHKYVAFVTAGRVELGAVFAAGVASVHGTVEEHSYSYQFLNTSRGVVVQPTEDVTSLPLANILSLRSTMFIGKAEPTVAVILGPGLKIRAGGGLNFPAYPSLTLGVSYLIGAKAY